MSEEKSSYLTSDEKTLLLSIINKHITVVENKCTKDKAKCEKAKAWVQIASEFNSNSSVQKRTSDQLKIWWGNTKARTKKSVVKHKKETSKTGGGSCPAKLPEEINDVLNMIPMQMNSLTNVFDCDSIQDEGREGSNMLKNENDEEFKLSSSGSTPKSSPTKAGTSVKFQMKRKRSNPRSSITDMEFEEHNIRMKTYFAQYETAQIEKKMAIDTEKRQKIDFEMNFKHKTEIHEMKKELMRAQMSANLTQFQIIENFDCSSQK